MGSPGVSMAEPNDVLREEHEAMELLVSAVEGMAGRLQGQGPYPRKDLETAITVITEFGDKCHHAKEEKALFPALAKASPGTGAEIARRLTSDHRAFRQIVGTMRTQVPKAETDAATRALLAKNLDTYARLLRVHIEAENTQLMPEVDRAIPPAERDKIAEEFERIEEQEVGSGVHEKYHHMIHKLADAYAG